MAPWYFYHLYRMNGGLNGLYGKYSPFLKISAIPIYISISFFCFIVEQQGSQKHALMMIIRSVFSTTKYLSPGRNYVAML